MIKFQKPLIAFRRCSRCGKDKPATTDYFYRQNTENRFSSRCRECHRKWEQVKRKQQSLLQKGIAPVGFKKCSKCDEIKPDTNDFFSKTGKDGKLRSACKKCCAKYAREYKEKTSCMQALAIKKQEEKKNLNVKLILYCFIVLLVLYIIFIK